MMRYLKLQVFCCLAASLPGSVVAQGTHAAQRKDTAKSESVLTDDDFKSAIDTIATSKDRDAVYAAALRLRNGGLPAIHALTRNLQDRRQTKSDYLTRAVSGPVDMSDHRFWLIQEMLETHQSKLDSALSPLDKQNITKWLSDREGMSLVELRRDACIGAFEKILALGKSHPRYNVGAALKSYAKRLVELDRAVQKYRDLKRTEEHGKSKQAKATR